MKKAILMALVLSVLIAPCALIAQAVVVPNQANLDWWEYLKLHGVPPGGSIGPFPTPVPHVGNPPTVRPSPPPVPASGTSVVVRPATPVPPAVPVRPTPPVYPPQYATPYSPLFVAPIVAAPWGFDELQYGDSSPLLDANGTDIQPGSTYAAPAAQNNALEIAKPAPDNWEAGTSGTPTANPLTNTWDALVGFHFAYAWNDLYISWDSIAVPNYMVQAWTGGYFDSFGNYVLGYNVPGFLNLWDVGFRFIIQPTLVGIAEVGVNNLYVYQQGILAGGVGANVRLGAGMKFGFWGFSLTATSVYESWDDLTSTIGGLFSSDTQASSWNRIAQSLVPSLQLTFYF